MTQAVVVANATYTLVAEIKELETVPGQFGVSFKSHVPIARRPEEQTKLHFVTDKPGLKALAEACLLELRNS